ncbi:DUF3616 domain-containing protein [Thiomicrorhabdus sp.]|uniref:DUF3616 domain-containing protein n=1 Tax=Thiomicrorhabdus sp. TaxID=2039724 RepID=UPI0035654247
MKNLLRFASILCSLTLIGLVIPSWATANPNETQPLATPYAEQTWAFSDALKIDAKNISGIVVTSDFMALASDEGYQLELFTPNSVGEWSSAGLIDLTRSTDELDIEGLAWQSPYLYAIGSHSLKRKKLKSELAQKQNLKRLQEVVEEPARHQLFRIKLNKKFKATEIKAMSLDSILHQDPALKRFTQIPSKENGIDIEGLGLDEKGRLLIGFRGPVLRGNAVPVLRLKLEKDDFTVKKSKMLYLHTENGGGIRGISETKSGLLILSGAVGDQNLPYQVSLWNGDNGLQGNDAKTDTLQPLCELPASTGKPEGIQFLSQTQQQVRFVIVQDGLTNGQPTTFSCRLPSN